MSITLGNARRNASSTVSPLMPRLYTCGSNRSSSRRRGTLSQSCLMLFLVSVMHPLYLTETSETRTNYLENQHFSTLRPSRFAPQHGAFGASSARFEPFRPSLLSMSARAFGHAQAEMLRSRRAERGGVLKAKAKPERADKRPTGRVLTC